MEPNAQLSPKRANGSLMSEIRGHQLGAVLTVQICFTSSHRASQSQEKFTMTREMCRTAQRYTYRSVLYFYSLLSLHSALLIFITLNVCSNNYKNAILCRNLK